MHDDRHLTAQLMLLGYIAPGSVFERPSLLEQYWAAALGILVLLALYVILVLGVGHGEGRRFGDRDRAT